MISFLPGDSPAVATGLIKPSNTLTVQYVDRSGRYKRLMLGAPSPGGFFSAGR
jgi:hypothetical protein